MGGIQLPALQGRPPEIEDSLSQYSKAVALKSALQNQQFQSQMQPQMLQQQQMENQQRQYQIAQTQAINDAYHAALKPDANGVPQIDKPTLIKSLSLSGHGSAVTPILENLTKYEVAVEGLQKTQGEVQQQQRDSMGYLGQAIQTSKYDPHLADLLIQQRLTRPGIPQAEAQQLQQIRQMIQANPDTLKQLVDNMVSQSAKPREVAAGEMRQKTDADALKAKMPGGALYPPTIAAEEAKNRLTVTNSPEAIAGAARKAAAVGTAEIPVAVARAVATQKATQQLLEGPAKDMAAENYFQTGQLPAGARSPGMISSIINRAAELHPGGDLSANRAAYGANKASYASVTKTLDALSGFEQAGLKNLKQFTDAAQKIPDTGVPWINTPVRLLNEKMMGSPDQAAAVAAGQVALREIARVTSNPNLTGALSDTARHEVSSLIPANATLPQIKRVAQILQQDMANVHEGLANQKADIGRRLGIGGNQSGAATTPQAGKATHRYNPSTGKIEEIK